MNNLGNLVALFQRTQDALQSRARRAVDSSLVARNWLFGWYLVEFESAADDRSEIYGKQLIERISGQLKEAGITGTSPTNLRKFREFYQAYPEIRQTLSAESFRATGAITPEASKGTASLVDNIQQTLSVECPQLNPSIFDALASRFPLSWSHYVTLLSVSNPDERSFYEIEAAANDWSLRELKRQINSSLFERLALSRDKDQVKALAREGQIVTQAADLLKNPYVLEFLGIDKQNNYYDRHVKLADENPTVGIILCKRKKDALVEITLPEKSNIHASEYQLYLPSKAELAAQLDSVANEQIDN